MGRHSVPDEPEVGVSEDAQDALDLAAGRGRHARGEEAEDSNTQRIAIITDEPIEDRHDTDILVPFDRPADEAADGVADEVADRDADKAAAKAAKAAAKSERRAKRRESGTRADLLMLRQNAAVRAQALAAVIVSFVLYTVVMVVIGATDKYLQWLWTPIVVSGVLVGLVLDLANRRANKRPS